jgi:hypothetical protein
MMVIGLILWGAFIGSLAGLILTCKVERPYPKMKRIRKKLEKGL